MRRKRFSQLRFMRMQTYFVVRENHFTKVSVRLKREEMEGEGSDPGYTTQMLTTP